MYHNCFWDYKLKQNIPCEMTSPNEKSSAPFQLSKKRDSVIDQIGFQRRVDEVNLVGDANLWDKNLHGGMQSRLNQRERLYSSTDTSRSKTCSASKDGLDAMKSSPRFLERLRTPSYPIPFVSLHAFTKFFCNSKRLVVMFR